MQIGFIGLGHMGKTLAKRLISENVDLIVWNRKRRDSGRELQGEDYNRHYYKSL